MKLVALLSVVACAMMISLFGCGGGGAGTTDPPVTAGDSRAKLTFYWPERSRLIPLAAESIKVTFLNGSSVVATKTVARPSEGDQTTVNFTALPATTLTLTAVAYPNPDGTGTAQASASRTVTVLKDITNQYVMTMASTITTINVSPVSPTINIGATASLTMTAYNSSSVAVLTDPSTITWTSTDESVATVNDSGVVTGVKAGTAIIRATDSESGVTGASTVTVSPGTGGANIIVK